MEKIITDLRAMVAEDLLYSSGSKLHYRKRITDGLVEVYVHDDEGNVVETYVVSIALHAVTPGQ